MGPYLVFLSSTVNGYEGTGRSLSLKLIQQLRELSRPSLNANGSATAQDETVSSSTVSKKQKATTSASSTVSRSLKEIKLEEPIRYGTGDSIEAWLNSLLCLDASVVPLRRSITSAGAPHPSQCDLYHVSRDTLFSFHPASEAFLQRMMALYVASHYKNSPNDLQLLSDAPGHRLFVLLPPIVEDGKDGSSRLPEPLVVMQVALEGRISKESILKSLERGQRAGGDLIPWTISQQFQDDDFATLSGARVVRIAVHPDYARVCVEIQLAPMRWCLLLTYLFFSFLDGVRCPCSAGTRCLLQWSVAQP
jgi:N-acetyltransferase 10